ncbi:MAG: hypothetical protein JW981_09010, partial [Anaerolineae bacterium]|nr:hypothetical protein [Anaerolineae bacterium]
MRKTLCDNSKYVLLPLSIIVVLSLLGCAGTAVKNTPVPGETPTVTPKIPTLTTTPSPTITPSPVPVTETLAYESAEAHPILWPTENWTPSVPEVQGIDSHALAAMFSYVRDGSLGLNSIFIVRNGFLVA